MRNSSNLFTPREAGLSEHQGIVIDEAGLVLQRFGVASAWDGREVRFGCGVKAWPGAQFGPSPCPLDCLSQPVGGGVDEGPAEHRV